MGLEGSATTLIGINSHFYKYTFHYIQVTVPIEITPYPQIYTTKSSDSYKKVSI